jgi:SAM-dependent methyltransferase
MTGLRPASSTSERAILLSKTLTQKVKDHLCAPLRLTFLSDDACARLGITSINVERIDYALHFVHGDLLDVGCGRNNLVKKYAGFGVGVDVFDWLEGALILKDTSRLPFLDHSFDTVTVLAALNHIPNREDVLTEIRRVLRPNGRLVMTMLTPVLSAIGHKLLWWYSDDWVRGMGEGEVYGFTPQQMTDMAASHQFELLDHRRFLYRLNHLYIFRKHGTAR